jgi:hypothetical protein
MTRSGIERQARAFLPPASAEFDEWLARPREAAAGAARQPSPGGGQR